jgi:hypothetical protein
MDPEIDAMLRVGHAGYPEQGETSGELLREAENMLASNPTPPRP